MRNFFTVLLLAVLLMLANQCKPSGERDATDARDTTVIIHTIACLSDTVQTYCIALPPGFKNDNPYPVVFVFDPHGNGDLAVNNFRAGATEFGYIIAGSNVIRNGYKRIDYALQTLTNDVTSRYPVDRKRMYAAGFSGGGRVAQLFSQLNPDIRAVVSAGAGYSLTQPELIRNKASMLFMVGNEDFNYPEIVNSQKALSSSGIHYYVIEYPGKHAWPGYEFLHEGLQWFEFDAYRRDPARKQKPTVKKYVTAIQQRVTLLENKHDYIGAVNACEKGIVFLSEIMHTNSLKKKLVTLEESPEYRHARKQKQDVLALEIRLQQGYIAALREKDTLWWKNEIKGLDKKISITTDSFLQPVYKRINSFISIAAYSFCNSALQQNDLLNADKYISVYQIVDPGNPDGYYFKALLLSKSGYTKIAGQHLKKAISMGFTDYIRAQQELPEEVYSNGVQGK